MYLVAYPETQKKIQEELDKSRSRFELPFAEDWALILSSVLFILKTKPLAERENPDCLIDSYCLIWKLLS